MFYPLSIIIIILVALRQLNYHCLSLCHYPILACPQFVAHLQGCNFQERKTCERLEETNISKGTVLLYLIDFAKNTSVTGTSLRVLLRLLANLMAVKSS